MTESQTSTVLNRNEPLNRTSKLSPASRFAIVVAILLLASVLGAGSTFVLDYLFPGKLKYRSQSKILIEFNHEAVNKSVPEEGVAELKSIDHASKLKSDEMISAIVVRTDLKAFKTFQGMDPATAKRFLAENIVVQQDPEEPHLFVISFDAADAVESNIIVTMIVAEYQSLLVMVRSKVELEKSEQLRDATEKLEKQLRNEITEYRKLQSKFDFAEADSESNSTINEELTKRDQKIGRMRTKLQMLRTEWVRMDPGGLQMLRLEKFRFSVLERPEDGVRIRRPRWLILGSGALLGALTGFVAVVGVSVLLWLGRGRE